MASAGFDRDISKLKSQLVKMKVSARKAVASVKRASVATGNSAVIPELSAGADLVQSIRVSYEFIEKENINTTIPELCSQKLIIVQLK